MSSLLKKALSHRMTNSRDKIKSERNNGEPDKKSVSLLDLPIELDYVIANQRPYNEATKIMATLSITCKHFQGQVGFFKQNLEKRASNQLGIYIESGDIVNAEKMVKANPRLLLCPIEKIINPQTQQIIEEMTPLQAAYCEGDDKMCLMLERYFENACVSKEAGRKEVDRQLEEKFGEGKDEDKESKQVRKNRLATIVQAITKEQFNNGRDAVTNKLILSEATQRAIATFREEFTASQPKIIQQGKRFHLERIKEVCAAYIKAMKLWGYDYPKSALFGDAILTIVLSYASKNDAMRFAQGLYYLQDEREEFKLSITTRDGHNFYHQVLHSESSFFSSLSGSCVDILFGGFAMTPYLAGYMERLQNLSRAKTSTLENLCSRTHERKYLSV